MVRQAFLIASLCVVTAGPRAAEVSFRFTDVAVPSGLTLPAAAGSTAYAPAAT